ncbi:MAG: cyclase family protein [Oscillospiraceae bacterium]|jgi:arylformamidase|nr:cyclase family protein [Oscillospiraceae bacterium]
MTSDFYDCSRPIDSSTPVYPGDTPPVVTTREDMNLSDITMGLHTATHIDAPLHSFDGAKNLDEIPLDRYVGKCRLLEITGAPVITAEHLKAYDLLRDEIILLKTDNSSKPLGGPFDHSFVGIDKSAADLLVSRGVKTIGIDYNSIENGTKDVHLTVLGAEMSIIEGLYFRDVPAGEYFICAAPLRITGVEGAPCRALLFGLPR